MRKLVIILILLALSTSVQGHEFKIGRSIGMGGGLRLSSPSATDFINCPAVLLGEGEYVFEAGYHRLFELSELDRVYAAGGYNYRDLSFGVGFSQLGKTNYYVEQIVKGALAYRYAHYAFGLTVSGRILEIGADQRREKLSNLAFGLIAGFNYRPYHLGITLDNLNQPKLYDGHDGEKINGDIFIEIEGPSLFSIITRAGFEDGQRTVFSIGQYFMLPAENAIFLGIQSDPIMYGGGMDVFYAGFRLTYAVNHHPVLGFTHNISLNYSGTGDKEH